MVRGEGQCLMKGKGVLVGGLEGRFARKGKRKVGGRRVNLGMEQGLWGGVRKAKDTCQIYF